VSDLPAGTVTFLFTDIEGSTRLWREQPEQMKAALARHDSLLREVIESRRGNVVKTTGDGVHAVFSMADDAVNAAVEAQRAIAAEPWPLPEALGVRIGMHSGPADLRDGDYFGTAVNRAARIMSVAHGGGDCRVQRDR
jgi:class 3 adenylate cyclase